MDKKEAPSLDMTIALAVQHYENDLPALEQRLAQLQNLELQARDEKNQVIGQISALKTIIAFHKNQ